MFWYVGQLLTSRHRQTSQKIQIFVSTARMKSNLSRHEIYQNITHWLYAFTVHNRQKSYGSWQLNSFTAIYSYSISFTILFQVHWAKLYKKNSSWSLLLLQSVIWLENDTVYAGSLQWRSVIWICYKKSDIKNTKLYLYLSHHVGMEQEQTVSVCDVSFGNRYGPV